MAAMCVTLGISPRDYWAMTVAEHAALLEALKEKGKPQRRR